MQLTGRNIIAGGFADGSGEPFEAIAAATGEPLGPSFQAAGAPEVERACALAAEAFDSFRESDLETRARFLEAIADELEALGDDLIARAMQETGLARGRLEGERARTMGQLRLFASVVRQGDWLEARLDSADPERRPVPKPDLRLRMIPLGPVVVFGASNFPLAFSVAGGDTASAFAAGCPVIVKGHPAHPGTGELAGLAVQRAAAKTGLHPGVFALLNGPSNALGEALVADPRVAAVGFTGSRGGGLALMRIAAARKEPIPVYAEMSSVNPVFLGPRALAERADAIAEGFVGSLTMGAGQFCTNPGLVFGPDGPELDRFVQAAAAKLGGAPSAVMLTSGIRRAYESSCAILAEHPSVRERGRGEDPSGSYHASARLYETTAAALTADEALEREVFGATSLVVRCPDPEAMARLAGKLEGQLTATLQMEAADADWARRLIPVLERKVGRILANGWPTGVEVGHAMVHGGPFPATSDGRGTSVGTLAIRRFLRPVCYQDLPDALLPQALQASNPMRLNRRINGVVEKA